jgi:hypothetical protein
MVGVDRACLVRFKRESALLGACACLTLLRLVEEAVSLKGGRRVGTLFPRVCFACPKHLLRLYPHLSLCNISLSLSIAPVRRSITPLRCGLILSFFLLIRSVSRCFGQSRHDRHSFRLSSSSSFFQQQPPCFFPNPTL